VVPAGWGDEMQKKFWITENGLTPAIPDDATNFPQKSAIIGMNRSPEFYTIIMVDTHYLMKHDELVYDGDKPIKLSDLFKSMFGS
jgi:hypothetical protein